MKILWLVLLPVLIPTAILYAVVTWLRNILYDIRFLPSYEIQNANVISVGNMTAGGTGKTPITAFIVEEFIRSGFSIGIVSRGYGGTYTDIFPQGFAPVHPQMKDAAVIFGDEPTWFAQKFQQAAVWVGRDKVQTANSLTQETNCQVVVADDAFQHRRLKRLQDIVVIDASASLLEYLPLPLGRGREDFVLGLRRADVIVLNKVNLASHAQLKRIRALIAFFKKENSNLFEAKTEITFYTLLSSGEKFLIAQNEAVFLVSGIARPEQFLKSVTQSKEVQIKGHLALPDHAKYDQDMIKKIESLAIQSKANYIVVTEKDAVKLVGVKLGLPVVVSHLELTAPELTNAIRTWISR